MKKHKPFQHAVVIGGSIGGLMAARTLADYFEKVTILEKDTLPDGPEPHKTVPQGHHIHVVLGQGKDFLEDCFPGIVREIEATGGNVVDITKDTSWFFEGSWRSRHTSNISILLSLRPHVDWHFKCRLLAEYPNVTMRENCHVAGFLANSDNTCVTGVRLKQGESATEPVTADLVVDSSGRGSQTPDWLAAIGYNKPPEEEIGIGLCYTSRIYKRPVNFNEDWKILMMFPTLSRSWRGGIISSVQDDQWIVTLNGSFGEAAPVDDEGFLEYARTFDRPDIYNWIKHETQVGPTKTFKVPKIRRRYYEKLSRLPDGLIVVGDANCAFNPIFGQGITAASRYAWQLGESLRTQVAQSPANIKGFSKAYHKQISKHLDLPWFLTTMMDLSYRQTKGKRPFGMPVITWFFKCALETCSRNASVQQSFVKVMNMYAGLGALLKPSFVLPVLLQGIKRVFIPLSKRAHTGRIPRATDTPFSAELQNKPVDQPVMAE